MSRFVAPDLDALPPPPAIEEVDFEARLSARLASFAGYAAEYGFEWDAPGDTTDAIHPAQRAGAFAEVNVLARVNDAVSETLLVTAAGAQLDHIAATYYGISRREGEGDETFRARIALAPEAWSTAGPEGAYLYHALEADPDVLDAAIYSEEDGAAYPDGPVLVHRRYDGNGAIVMDWEERAGEDLLAPEVLVVVLARSGDGAPSQAVIEAVGRDLSPTDVRPIGDRVVVTGATITAYRIEATLTYARGADGSAIADAARERVKAYVAARRRVGAVVQRLGIGAALKVTDVAEIAIAEPAEDVDPGSLGAAWCTDIEITAVVGEETWR